jgi:hypothetical protein
VFRSASRRRLGRDLTPAWEVWLDTGWRSSRSPMLATTSSGNRGTGAGSSLTLAQRRFAAMERSTASQSVFQRQWSVTCTASGCTAVIAAPQAAARSRQTETARRRWPGLCWVRKGARTLTHPAQKSARTLPYTGNKHFHQPHIEPQARLPAPDYSRTSHQATGRNRQHRSEANHATRTRHPRPPIPVSRHRRALVRAHPPRSTPRAPPGARALPCAGTARFW